MNKKLGFDLKCLLALFKLIISEKPDVVHVHSAAIPYLLIASVLYRKCLYVATIHSEATREAGTGINKLIRQFLFKNRLVVPITISEESKESFDKFYSMDSTMIYNGISKYEEGDSIDYPEYKTIFVHPASCQPVKNQELLFKCFTRLSEKYEDVELHWYGDKEKHRDLYNHLSQYLGSNIKYCGLVNDIRKYLKNADYMCLSSEMEGMPITIIEAMSVGCIPIVTPVGGCINMIQDERNGFISTDLSVESYCSVLEKAIKTSKVTRMGMKEKAMVSFMMNFSINNTANLYLDVFKKFNL